MTEKQIYLDSRTCRRNGATVLANPPFGARAETGALMKSRTKIIVLVASVVLFVAAFFWLLTTHGPLAPVGVQLGSVVRVDLTPGVFGIGTVDARLSYAVGPIAPGRVLRVLVDQGDEVKAGQLLAEMDPVDMDRRVQAAKSTGARSRQAARVADAQVAEAASRARLAIMNRDRDRGLYEQRVVSKQALDNSTGEAERAEAALAGGIRTMASSLSASSSVPYDVDPWSTHDDGGYDFVIADAAARSR